VPLISRLLIRCALGYLVAAMVIAAGSAFPRWAALRPTWIHLLVVGWLTQLIFGVAIWLFPRTSGAPWGNERLAWLGFAGLNLGLLLRLVAEPWLRMEARTTLLVLSAAGQTIGVMAFVASLWPRVRGK